MAAKRKSAAPRRPSPSAGRSSPFWASVKTAFAFGLGAIAASVVYALFGVALMVAGYLLRNKEQAKPEGERARWKEVTGLALMGLGVVLLGGAGLHSLLGEASEEL